MVTHADRLLDLARTRSVLRSKDLGPLGIPRQTLARLHRRGDLERVGRGLYVLAGADVTERHTLVTAARRVPHGVACLLSALRFHDLTTQAPFEVWFAIEGKARRPKQEAIPLRVVYMSGGAFTEGIETHELEGIEVRVFSAAKTVADCFKYRNRVGLGVAIEALKDYRWSPTFDADALWHFAQVCRVSTVMRPYLEAVV
ncbi:type IV toxin-antitoxin system AbiEi family antitoxin domain-containing protein [Rubrivirga litoralis]|uniref:type IV toxin-antitoxin system AbiEi family antitoxin domain-containing protein n=1 Tax=Rubrivirga litoralis TaxID=3075598 RepID=UPI0032C23574